MTEHSEHHYHPMGEPLEQEAEALVNPEGTVEVPPREQMSLIRRLRQPRTLLSFAVPLAIIVIFVAMNWKDMQKVPSDIAHANPWLILAAFAIYYVGFPLRGWRWTRLLRGAGYKVKVKDGTEILFLSWLVNCIVPAKLGDLYRAYLLRQNSPVSATRTLGTVFMERMIDLIVIASLGLAAGIFRWRGSLGTLPQTVQVLFVMGVVVVVLLIVALIAMRNFGRRLLAVLPLPHKVVDFYERFEEGVFGSVGPRGLPVLGVVSGLIWLTEAMRLYLVVRALGFSDVDLGLSGALFVALIGSLLTAVPFTPAGLGLVEGGMAVILTKVFNASSGSAAAIIVVDRAISVFTIIILGSVAYMISGKPRGAGMKVEEIESRSGAAARAG